MLLSSHFYEIWTGYLTNHVYPLIFGRSPLCRRLEFHQYCECILVFNTSHLLLWQVNMCTTAINMANSAHCIWWTHPGRWCRYNVKDEFICATPSNDTTYSLPDERYRHRLTGIQIRNIWGSTQGLFYTKIRRKKMS